MYFNWHRTFDLSERCDVSEQTFPDESCKSSLRTQIEQQNNPPWPKQNATYDAYSNVQSTLHIRVCRETTVGGDSTVFFFSVWATGLEDVRTFVQSESKLLDSVKHSSGKWREKLSVLMRDALCVDLHPQSLAVVLAVTIVVSVFRSLSGRKERS